MFSRIKVKIDEWNVYTISGFKDKNPSTKKYYSYYMDVPDDKSKNRLEVQSRLWSFYFWWCGCDWPMPYSAKKIVGGINYYHINAAGHFQLFKVQQGSSWLTYKIETKGLERVNTIAVYQNGSFYDDHYPSIERINVITLDVMDTGALFAQGINVILIPTNLFANTKFHAII